MATDDRIQTWIASQIEACSPANTGASRAVHDLVGARAFLDGKASQIFGMAAKRDALPDVGALREACDAMIRRWYARLGDAEKVELYEHARRIGLDLPEPDAVREREEREAALADALATLPSPLAALALTWPEGEASVRDLLDLGRREKPARFGGAFSPDRILDASAFEWTRDDWRDVVAVGRDPAMFPFAGADGDALGLYLDVDLLREGVGAPVVYFFHELDPPYTWVCEGPVQARALLEAGRRHARVDRGRRPHRVDERLAALGAHGAPELDTLRASRGFLWSEDEKDARAVYERAGNVFAATYLDALARTSASPERA